MPGGNVNRDPPGAAVVSFGVGHGAAGAATVHHFPRVTPRWLSRSPELRAHLLGGPWDLVHNHALWLLPLHYAHQAAKRKGVPLVISPRGMLSGWAYRHRRSRKVPVRLLH